MVSRPAREMPGYPPDASRQVPAEVRSRLIRLDSNENPFGPSPRAIEAMRMALGASNAYPDDDCSELRRTLAAYHSMPPEQVLVTAGSTALLSLLCQTLLAPGLNAITSERSFIVYSMAVHASGARLIQTPMRDDGFDLAAILNAIDEDTRLIFLANPNNPTGSAIDAAAVDSFLAEIPGHVVVVLDEAYYEFASHVATLRHLEYSHSLDSLRSGANVVVLRTFSKAHGLAGLRIGYGLGPAELLAYCARMRNTFSVSSLAQAAALAAIEDHDHIARTVANNASQAPLVGVELSELGYRVVPSAANFLYCEVGGDASELAARLRAEGISVRALGVWGAPECIRVTIGTPDQNRSFLDAIRRVTANAPPVAVRGQD
ncbi:MAG TPA: histidinol-phosphate transaminase [Verrucomicrobiae bacterium]|nr:histidinol-phosphate transaminase [Verrucomicrobiae bacterium]